MNVGSVTVSTIENLSADSGNWDTLCIIDRQEPSDLAAHFTALRSIDKAFDNEVSVFKVPGNIGRVVYSPVYKLEDYDDVRAYEKASAKAIARAIKAGSTAPVLVLPTSVDKKQKFKYATLCSLLGVLQELYVPIQLREDVPANKTRVEKIGIYYSDKEKLKVIFEKAMMYERGRYIARDIGVGDPERMAPPRVVKHLEQTFSSNKSIKMSVITDSEIFRKKYPLFEAVNRAASCVERHRGAIVFLEYVPPKPARKTLMLVGKGVTYDTGGADVKAGGVMAGMSRDKCGAAAVAGFMHIVGEKKPEDIHVIGALCLVRNSIGEECYVSDEVITSRAGVRVRVGNTDAEGRMAMADALCEMKEKAVNLPDPHLFTIATLTGHACLAVGEGYSIVVDNGPAREAGHGLKIKEAGELIGNPFEISTMQREDFDFHRGVCLGEDAVQSNNLPSSRTPRGHQTPAAFLMISSGLEVHGTLSSKPLKYSHMDIAASAGEYPHMPTGAPILALAETHLE